MLQFLFFNIFIFKNQILYDSCKCNPLVEIPKLNLKSNGQIGHASNQPVPLHRIRQAFVFRSTLATELVRPQ